ncbi:Acyl carrier protein [Micromonospora siamensis]|uniref:Acyl carrier protein n=2 Tax=Micromonospora siamensis TaxID=299152 RepID=A0A1C5J658_9ACTN|nr:Acyl carrier protein [Micromonospora siamensis]
MNDPEIQKVRAALAEFADLDAVLLTRHATTQVSPCLIAYVSPADIDQAALHAHARKHLPRHLVPAAIVVTDTIPATAAGLPDTQALPLPDLSGLASYEAPETTRQDILCDLFAEILRVPRVGIDDDFFGLGGRSVDAMMLAARISTDLGIRIRMVDLFEVSTVRGLDQLLQESEARS